MYMVFGTGGDTWRTTTGLNRGHVRIPQGFWCLTNQNKMVKRKRSPVRLVKCKQIKNHPNIKVKTIKFIFVLFTNAEKCVNAIKCQSNVVCIL